MKLKQILNVQYDNIKKIIPLLNKKEKSWFERYILVRLVLDERPILIGRPLRGPVLRVYKFSDFFGAFGTPSPPSASQGCNSKSRTNNHRVGFSTEGHALSLLPWLLP